MNACQCDVDKKLVWGGTLCKKLTVLAAAKLFYFQQQVTAGAVCSAASKTFTLGNYPCFTNIRTWQSSNGSLAQWSQLVIFSLLPNNTYHWRFRVQQRTIKVAANNSLHCTLAARPFPSQQHQAPEHACIPFSQISNHIYNQLIKMLLLFSSCFMYYHLDMRLLQGNHNMFCDIHIFSATITTAEALLFSIHELIIVKCSVHVQVKFCLVFLCKENFVWLFHGKKNFCVFVVQCVQ